MTGYDKPRAATLTAINAGCCKAWAESRRRAIRAGTGYGRVLGR